MQARRLTSRCSGPQRRRAWAVHAAQRSAPRQTSQPKAHAATGQHRRDDRTASRASSLAPPGNGIDDDDKTDRSPTPRPRPSAARAPPKLAFTSPAPAPGSAAALALGAALPVAQLCDELGIVYWLRGLMAAAAQGVELELAFDLPEPQAHVSVQHDLLEQLRAAAVQRFGPQHVQPACSAAAGGVHSFVCKPSAQCTAVRVSGEQGSVVAAEPHRLCVGIAPHTAGGRGHTAVWVESLWHLRRAAIAAPGLAEGTSRVERAVLAAAITDRLAQLQREVAATNAQAWGGSDTYAAWVVRFGPPAAAAAWVVADPTARLGRGIMRCLAEWGPPLTGARITNLLGSHGLKAIALAALGATVTVVDISAGNQRFALEAAGHARVSIRYIVSDVLHLEDAATGDPTGARKSLWQGQDWVLMENGILHYFVDLQALFNVVTRLLAPGGCMLLRDFHPVSTKLVQSTGAKHKVAGDYFDACLATSAAAFTKHQADAGRGKSASPAPGVMLRRWTLGEVVTAAATAGLVVCSLEEEPGPKAADAGLPKLFTLVARKP